MLLLPGERLQALIEAGANVDATTATKWTALYVASRYGYAEIVRVGLYNESVAHSTEYDRRCWSWPVPMSMLLPDTVGLPCT